MIEQKKQSINLYRINEHNEAFFYWQKSRLEGIIDENSDIFHIDAHDDMARPRLFRNSLYPSPGTDPLDHYERFAREELTIANFIFPAVLGGVVGNVYFFYPEWRNFKPRRATIRIASAFGEGRIIKYPGPIASDARTKTVDKALPDMKAFTYTALPVGRMPRKKKVILDIDLDYFACRDSVQNNWHYRLDITPDQYRHADTFLKNATLPFSGLEFTFKLEGETPVAVISFRKVSENAHLPTHEEIIGAIDLLTRTLVERAVRPAVITVCRSRFSGYCPAEYIKFIEDALLKNLAAIYPLNLHDSPPGPERHS
ncbi:MAG: UPF0489 family protein [Candidatus Aminicenantes bacterium]|nr:UPF0489 family protein [Candidatus Aminicenantes bacterium]